MPDYNPDKEGWHKKKFIVSRVERDFNKLVEPIHTGSGDLNVDLYGRCTVNDPGLAREIQKEHPRDITVTRVNWDDEVLHRNAIHSYFFGSLPALPWHKFDEFGRRIREAEEKSDG